MTIKTSTIWRFISYWTWGIFPASHVSKGGAWWGHWGGRWGFVRWPYFILQLSAWKWRIPKGNVKVRRGRSGHVTSKVVRSTPDRRGDDRDIFEGTQKVWWPRKNRFFFSTQSKNHVNWCFNPMWKIPMTSFFCSWKTGSVILHALGRWSKLTPAEFQHFLSVEIGRFSMNPQLGGWSLTFGVIGDLHFCSFCTLGLVM